MCLQWGIVANTTESPLVISFPIAFYQKTNTVILNDWSSPIFNVDNISYPWGTLPQEYATTHFIAYCENLYKRGVIWFAIGC